MQRVNMASHKDTFVFQMALAPPYLCSILPRLHPKSLIRSVHAPRSSLDLENVPVHVESSILYQL